MGTEGTGKKIAKAAGETGDRVYERSVAKEELLKREFAGERNVLTTRITALEQTAKEQSDRCSPWRYRRKTMWVRTSQ